MSNQEHWDRVYAGKEIEKLGWYQEIPQPDLGMIQDTGISSDKHIFIVGAGASTLLDHLLIAGYSRISVCDISKEALLMLKERNSSSDVQYYHTDICSMNVNIRGVDLWHDRAVLHFLTKEEDREAYRMQVLNMVKPGGFVILAAFSEQGATKCSGLDVYRYSASTLQSFLGEEFELLEAFDYQYTMPSGDTRPYIYTCFKRFW
ncbi:MAG: class I SAM-dependent methyltransferase [Candidatus Heimdallarchaeota archaeon]|nr:class I SAM-dependent methyltransferase [Candidatus Heimdallarchaeota archaeon]